MVKLWSDHGQTMVRPWTNYGLPWLPSMNYHVHGWPWLNRDPGAGGPPLFRIVRGKQQLV